MNTIKIALPPQFASHNHTSLIEHLEFWSSIEEQWFRVSFEAGLAMILGCFWYTVYSMLNNKYVPTT
jgi:hypothetical protein